MEIYFSKKHFKKILLFRIFVFPNQITPEKANVLHLLLLRCFSIKKKKKKKVNKMIFLLKSQLILVPKSQFKIKIKFHKINTLKQL